MDFNSLLKLMVAKNASDLFITSGVPPTIKVHGKLIPVTEGKLTADQSRQICYGIMNDKQRREYDATHECQFALSATSIGRFRVSAFQQRNYVGMVLRKIETTIPTMEELRLPPVLRDLAMTKRGLIIVVGATGTGKSTSLAAMIDHRNVSSTGHIITIEDPIEYIHQHKGCIITQREVGIDTDSFEVALKNTLRQAPDVILIGEVRTRQTMEHAITFADTGHLALGTLHANNANMALERIINFFPEEARSQLYMDLSLNLTALVAQMLIPTPDGKGRRAAVEVLINTPLVADHIRKGEIHMVKDIMKKSTRIGMRTFDQALHELYKSGEITYEDAIHHADSPNDLRLMIKLGEADADKLTSAGDGLALVEEEEKGRIM